MIKKCCNCASEFFDHELREGWCIDCWVLAAYGEPVQHIEHDPVTVDIPPIAPIAGMIAMSEAQFDEAIEQLRPPTTHEYFQHRRRCPNIHTSYGER